jgi:hypothetical protein
VAERRGVLETVEDVRDLGALNLDMIVDFAGFGTATANAITAVGSGGRAGESNSGTSVRHSCGVHGNPEGDIYIRSSDPDASFFRHHAYRRSSRPGDNDDP